MRFAFLIFFCCNKIRSLLWYSFNSLVASVTVIQRLPAYLFHSCLVSSCLLALVYIVFIVPALACLLAFLVSFFGTLLQLDCLLCHFLNCTFSFNFRLALLLNLHSAFSFFCPPPSVMTRILTVRLLAFSFTNHTYYLLVCLLVIAFACFPASCWLAFLFP